MSRGWRTTIGGVADTIETPTVEVLNKIVHGPQNDANPRPDTDVMHPVPTLVSELFRRARDARRDLLVQWKRNYRTMHNRDWRPGASPWDEASNPGVNQVYPVVASCTAWMTDQRPNLEVEASAEAYSEYWEFYNQLSRHMNVALQANFQNNLISAEISRVLWDVKQYGVGYFKTVWEPWLADGMGDVVPRRVDPFTIYPDPHARSPDQLTYIVEAKTMTVAEADRTWPGAARLIETAGFLEETDEAPHRLDTTTDPRKPRAALTHIHDATGAPIAGATPDNYDRRGHHRLRVSDSPVITVLEAYVRGYRVEATDDDDVSKVWDDWRCIVVTGNVVLLDKPCDDVNSWGGQPYDRVVDKDMGEWYGPCLVEQLAPIQRLINFLIGSIVRNIYLMGNPVLKEDPSSATRNKRFTNRPGQRVQGHGVEWLQPPQMQAQIAMPLVEFLKGEIENISGLSAMVRGFAPSGRNAQGVLDSVQDAAFVRVRESLRELERSLRSVTSKMASAIAEFYTEARKMSLIGPDGQRFHLALNSRHFYIDDDEAGERVPLRFSIVASAGSELPTSKQARSAEAKHLFAENAIDRFELLKAIDWPNYALVAQRMAEQDAMVAQAEATGGR